MRRAGGFCFCAVGVVRDVLRVRVLAFAFGFGPGLLRRLRAGCGPYSRVSAVCPLADLPQTTRITNANMINVETAVPNATCYSLAVAYFIHILYDSLW